MKRNIKVVLSVLAVLGCILAIFIFSSQTSAVSNTHSKAVARAILEAAGLNWEGGGDEAAIYAPFSLEDFNLILRKCSHAGIYLVLAVFTMVFASVYGWKDKRSVFITFFICSLIAVSDEIHQGFVQGRTPQAADVLLDCAGAVLGIAAFAIAKRILKERVNEASG